MVSLRFPFSYSQPPRKPNAPPSFSRAMAAVAVAAAGVGIGALAAAGVGIGARLAVSLRSGDWTGGLSRPTPWNGGSPMWASLTLADGAAGTSVEPKTGAAFPDVADGTRRLLGIGLRKKNVLGLKTIDVYAFGVYADNNDIKKLGEKYGKFSDSELKENKEFIADVLDEDLRMTVRLQIVYGRLSIRSVRSAFEESVGTRLQKLSGSDNKELLQRFTSLFKDEYKIPRGSVIDLSREQGYVLRTRIDGKEVGSIQSKLLCQSVLDLYIGEDPFDRHAKEDIQLGLASLLHK